MRMMCGFVGTVAKGVVEISGTGYAVYMAAGITYNKSAFKHGLTEADIEWAFLHPIRNGLLEGYENRR